MKEKSRGKHFTPNRKKSSKKMMLFIPIVVLVVLATIIFIINQKNNGNTNNEDSIESKIKIVEAEVANMPDTMGGYNVLGMLAIEKLGIAKNILEETTDEALNLSVTKFYGPNINEEGNFCITGHNYKDVFAYADTLELGDTFYIVDKINRQRVNYKIYDKYTVKPEDLDCLNQETNGKRVVTLITCNPGGLTRLIIKAQEI